MPRGRPVRRDATARPNSGAALMLSTVSAVQNRRRLSNRPCATAVRHPTRSTTDRARSPAGIGPNTGSSILPRRTSPAQMWQSTTSICGDGAMVVNGRRRSARTPILTVREIGAGNGASPIMLKDIGVDPVPNYTRDIKKGIARWDAYLLVPDPDALAAEFSSRNVEFFQPLMDNDDGLRGFEVKDADGYLLFFGRPRP